MLQQLEKLFCDLKIDSDNEQLSEQEIVQWDPHKLSLNDLWMMDRHTSHTWLQTSPDAGPTIYHCWANVVDARPAPIHGCPTSLDCLPMEQTGRHTVGLLNENITPVDCQFFTTVAPWTITISLETIRGLEWWTLIDFMSYITTQMINWFVIAMPAMQGLSALSVWLAYQFSGSKLRNMTVPWPAFSYKLRYIVGFWLVEMAISTNQKPTIYRNLYENTGPG